MGHITVTEILGSDNIAASRATIQSNFKTLVDEANKIETYLDTTPAGASLTVANAKITTNDPHAKVLLCEGSADIKGDVRVEGTLEAIDGIITRGNIEADGLSAATLNAGSVNSGAYVVEFSDAKVGDDNEVDLTDVSFLELEFEDEGTPATNEYTLAGMVDGQVVVLLLKGTAAEGVLNCGDTAYTIKAIEGNESFDGGAITCIFRIPKELDATYMYILSSTNCVITK